MRNLKKVLLSLGAVAAIAALATGGTFAVFTDQAEIDENDIDSGTVSISLAGSGDPVIDVEDMVIGDSKTGTLVVTNDGDNRATYKVTGSWTGDTDLEEALNIKVGDGTSVDKKLDLFNADDPGIAVGSLAPGGSETYTIEVSLPTAGSTTADNLLQDLSGSETFTVDAVQRDGVNRDTGDPDA